jgi:cyclic pyranopterin phosphate synthase
MPIDLTDTQNRPLRDLRISVTDRCNFRCPYCMPAEVFGEKYQFLPRSEILTFEEIARLARLFVDLGVGKIRITGGEPLLRQEVVKLVEQLAAIPGDQDLALTTNGYLLAGKARELRKAGLRRLTVSLDSLDDAVFRRMNGLGYGVSEVLEGIKAAEDAGFSPLKINTVVQRGTNDEGILDLVRHFHGTGHVLRFIEYMDVGTRNDWALDKVVPAEEILERVSDEFPIEPIDPNYPGEVARRYRHIDRQGEIGLISSVTQPFCGDCTRVRLSTDGRIYTCLFASDGIDLREPLLAGESDCEISDRISRIWSRRTDRYSECRSTETTGLPRVEMYQIGG